MRKLRTEKTAEVKEFRLRLEHLKTHKDHSTKLKSEISEGQDKDRNYMSQINELEEQARVCECCITFTDNQGSCRQSHCKICHCRPLCIYNACVA